MNQQKDKQHFSHKHILKPLQLHEGEDITCHACKNYIEEESFYGCIDCEYFLDEICSDAPRSMVHPSHPTHPLTLLATATYPNRTFICNACGVVGDSFCFSCADCAFDLHLLCSFLPPTFFLAKEHPHELELVCEPEKLLLITANKMVVCYVCDVVINHEYWFHYCAQCKVGVHLNCLFSKYVEEEEEENEGITANRELLDNEEYLSLSPPSSPSSSSSFSSLSSGREKEPNRAKTRQELEEAILESLREMARIAKKLVLDVFSAVAHYVTTSYTTRNNSR